MADAIKRALTMPLEERRRRWRALMDSVERDNVMEWRDDFVRRLDEAHTVSSVPSPLRRVREQR
jgi:trehalose 6-phosphate synthase